MAFGSFVWGMIEIELTSGAPEAAFQAFADANIEIRQLRQADALTSTFWISRRNLEALVDVARKRGDIWKIRKKQGISFLGKRLGQRSMLLIGGILLLALVLWLPSRVLIIQVEGNDRIPANQIIDAAQDCGIAFGASRRQVRSERVKNALLSAVPQLQWAGVNTFGCRAVISVRERSDTRQEERQPLPASLVALRDGYVLSCTATKGTALVKPGQSVQEGQILISAYTDCGLTIRAEQAEGEILAQTNREFQAVTPSCTVKKGQTQSVKRKLSLLIGKKRINLWKDSGIWEGSCGRMYTEYYITLPGGFRLPAALCVEEYVFAELTQAELTQTDAETGLKAFADRSLREQMAAGKILAGVQTVEPEDGRYRLTGKYACVEMIGKLRQEQIGDTNGKIN